MPMFPFYTSIKREHRSIKREHIEVEHVEEREEDNIWKKRTYRSIKREHLPEIDSGSSFFLVQILKTFLYSWRMTSKLS